MVCYSVRVKLDSGASVRHLQGSQGHTDFWDPVLGSKQRYLKTLQLPDPSHGDSWSCLSSPKLNTLDLSQVTGLPGSGMRGGGLCYLQPPRVAGRVLVCGVSQPLEKGRRRPKLRAVACSGPPAQQQGRAPGKPRSLAGSLVPCAEGGVGLLQGTPSSAYRLHCRRWRVWGSKRTVRTEGGRAG